MSQDNSALLPVEFHGHILFIVDHRGEPFAAMRPIVEAMGMDWASQFVKIKARYESVIAEIATTGSDGKRYAMTCLPLRKLAGWLMTIHPNKVRADLRETIIAYQAECDDALWSYWTQRQAPTLAAPQPSIAPPVPDINRATRWLATFTGDRWVMFEIPKGAFVLTADQWPSVIRTTDFPRRLLADVLAAVSERLQEKKA